jgi:ABC-type multidrug transport system ATPase subunit
MPDKGRAEVLGMDVARNRERLRDMIGLAGQYAAVDEYLTGRENLIMVGELYHQPRSKAQKRADELLERFGLTDAGNRPAKTYSGGMRHRLDLAASLVGNPQVLFLDEPTTGLDPRTRLDLWELIRELVDEGMTLLLTTQYLEEADELAHRIAIIDEGKIIAEDTADALKRNLGSDVLELRVQSEHELDRAVEVIESTGVGAEKPKTDRESGLVRLPVANGAQGLVTVVRHLDDADIKLADLQLRQPSLDDVFLSLTGQRTGQSNGKDKQNGSNS